MKTELTDENNIISHVETIKIFIFYCFANNHIGHKTARLLLDANQVIRNSEIKDIVKISKKGGEFFNDNLYKMEKKTLKAFKLPAIVTMSHKGHSVSTSSEKIRQCAIDIVKETINKEIKKEKPWKRTIKAK